MPFLCQYEGCLRLDSLEAEPEMEECSQRGKNTLREGGKWNKARGEAGQKCDFRKNLASA